MGGASIFQRSMEVFDMAHAIVTSSGAMQSLNIFGQPLTIFGVPVDREKIFANHKGIYQKRVEKRQRKLIVDRKSVV
jgi:hypothetical protein